MRLDAPVDMEFPTAAEGRNQRDHHGDTETWSSLRPQPKGRNHGRNGKTRKFDRRAQPEFTLPGKGRPRQRPGRGNAREGRTTSRCRSRRERPTLSDGPSSHAAESAQDAHKSGISSTEFWREVFGGHTVVRDHCPEPMSPVEQTFPQEDGYSQKVTKTSLRNQNGRSACLRQSAQANKLSIVSSTMDVPTAHHVCSGRWS